MDLLAKQQLFAQLAARLIQHAAALGYQVTLGEAWRSNAEAMRLAAQGLGIERSLHCQRLAIDLQLFKGSTWLKASEDYTPLGEWWEGQHELCRWGGRFGDGNHFSLEHQGRK